MSFSHNKSDPRVERTRALILDSFSQLLQERGFEAMTVSDIAQYATINRATFYAHFTDKHALLKHKIATEFDKALRQILAREDTVNEATLRKIVFLLCHFVGGNHERCQEAGLTYRPLIEQEVRSYLSGFLAQRLVRKNGESGIPTELAAEVLTAALYATASYWASQASESPQLFADRAVKLLLPLLNI